MAASQRLYLRVGALMVIGLGLAVGFILFLTANRLGDTAVVYETYLRESVQGLEPGAPVRYRGVSIGRVTAISLVSAEYRRPRGEPYISAFQLVLVRFSVELARIGDVPSLNDAIRLGLRVRIAAQGITGVNYLELDFVDADRFPPAAVPWTPRFSHIPAIPSTVAQVQTAAETLLQRLQEADLPGLLMNVNGLVTDLREQVQDGELAATLRDATALLRYLRAEAERSDLPGALAELRGVAADARALLGGDDARRALANAAAAAEALRDAASRPPRTSAALEQSARGARAVVGDVQADLGPVLRDLRAAVANLRETTETLRRSPGQALFGAPPPAERR